MGVFKELSEMAINDGEYFVTCKFGHRYIALCYVLLMVYLLLLTSLSDQLKCARQIKIATLCRGGYFFHGSGDLIRTDDTPGMNRTRVAARGVEKILKRSLITMVFGIYR